MRPSKPAKTAQIARFFPGAPQAISSALLRFGRLGKLGRLFAVVEELVERDFHGPRQLFERLDRRNGVAVLHARDVAAEQSGALFDVALGKFFCFA